MFFGSTDLDSTDTVNMNGVLTVDNTASERRVGSALERRAKPAAIGEVDESKPGFLEIVGLFMGVFLKTGEGGCE